MAVGTALPAMAESGSERFCEDVLGGTYTKNGPDSECLVEGKNPKFEQETTGHGNIGNRTEEDCSPTGSDKCPPGQFN
jgi:hypothetical protein